MQKYFNSHYHIATLILLLILSILFFATYVDLRQSIHIILSILLLIVTAATLYFGVQVGLVASLMILFVIGTALISVGLRLSLVSNIPNDAISFEMFIVFGIIFLFAVIVSGLIHLRVKTYFTQREKLLDDLELYTSMDIVTSFDNKTRMQIEVKREMERVKRHNGLFTLLYISLDHFKEFEQTYGPNEVSHLLKSIGQKINDATRTTDRKYRFDDNKFALLFVETRRNDIEFIIEKLAKILERHQLLNTKYVTLHYHVSYAEYNQAMKEVSYEDFVAELERELVMYAM